MSDNRTFMQLVMQGHADPEDIEDFVDDWHDSSSDLELHEFLGMALSEYSLLLSDSYAMPIIIKARRDRMPLAQAVNDNLRDEGRIAARSGDASKLKALYHWIDAQPDR